MTAVEIDEHVDVLIGGGSLVGLSTALFLGRHGVKSLVVEHNPGSAIYPRAALFDQRTVEIYRNLGLETEVTEAAARSSDTSATSTRASSR